MHDNFSALALLVGVLAATRLTRLVVEDTWPPVKAVRDRIVARHTRTEPVYQSFPGSDGTSEVRQIGERQVPDAWADLIECPWCSGAWICAGVVALQLLIWSWWRPVALGLAFSMVVGLIESRVDVD